LKARQFANLRNCHICNAARQSLPGTYWCPGKKHHGNCQCICVSRCVTEATRCTCIEVKLPVYTCLAPRQSVPALNQKACFTKTGCMSSESYNFGHASRVSLTRCHPFFTCSQSRGGWQLPLRSHPSTSRKFGTVNLLLILCVYSFITGVRLQ
jgi:hypothetical protein